MSDYDVVIIGGGPGGYVAAIRSAQLGKSVCLVEKEWVGGTCLNIGCIPTKALIMSAEKFAEIKKLETFGVKISGKVSYSLNEIMKRKKTVVSRSVKGVEFLLKKYGVMVERGEGEVISSGEVKIGDKKVGAKSIVIATGSKPKVVKVLKPDGKLILTSRETLDIEEVPGRFLIVGAGVIGIEMATFFNLLGAEVTIVEMLDSILPTVGALKLSKALEAQLKKSGIKILLGTTVQEIEKKENSVGVTFSNGEKCEFDRMLVAVGRVACFEGIDVQGLGLEMENGFIRTDETMKTNIQGLYAIGDVRGGMLLAHKASKEGIVAALNIAEVEAKMDYHSVPSCIFSHPPAALVGLTEKTARESGKKIKIGEYQYIGNSRAHTLGEKQGYVRVIADEEGIVLGGEILGAGADTLIQEITMACQFRMNVKELENVIHPHPTLSEIVMEAFDDVSGHSIHKPPVGK